MSWWERLVATFKRPWVYRPLVCLLAFGLGWVLSVVLIPSPKVGVIRFQDYIWYGSTDWLEVQFRYAQEDPAIRAVLIEIDSPGGEAAASERLYYDLLRLRRSKPVVVMVNTMAASGGYYMAAAADAIYTTPSADVGNIGVISSLPSESLVEENYLFTGPFKAFGNPRDTYMRHMEVLKDSFIEAVFAQRGDSLDVERADRSTLSRGEIYVGTVAWQIGLVDEIGSRDDALEHAAQLAGLRDYEALDITEELSSAGQLPPLYYGPALKKWPAQLSKGDLPAGYYFLYLPPQERAPYQPAPKGGK
ncbi:MAG: S49 family peptidase [Chloroflexia bacterium]|nr:S49 family peptidase [Chloroflexia bacterium]